MPPIMVLFDAGHTEKLRAALEASWRADELGDLPGNIKLRLCLGPGDAPSPAGATVVFKVGASVAEGLSRPLAKMLVGPMASVSADSVLSLGADCGIKAEALRAVVEYMYTGRLELTAETAFDVLAATNFLELEAAKGLCVDFLRASLRPENALGMIRAGEQYDSAELAKDGRDFAAANFGEVAALDDFLALPAAEIGILVRLDTLVVSDEMAVHTALTRWVDHGGGSREGVYAKCFADASAVRLSQLSVAELNLLKSAPRQDTSR